MMRLRLVSVLCLFALCLFALLSPRAAMAQSCVKDTTGYRVINLDNFPNQEVWRLGANENVVFTGSATRTKRLRIEGGNNVVVKGVKFEPRYTWKVGGPNATGTIQTVRTNGSIWIEDVYIDNKNAFGSDAITLNSAGTKKIPATIINSTAINTSGAQQNELHPNDRAHGDILQPQGAISTLTVVNFNGSANYQGMFLMKQDNVGWGGKVDNVYLENVNLWHTARNTNCAYLLAFGGTSTQNVQLKNVTLTNQQRPGCAAKGYGDSVNVFSNARISGTVQYTTAKGPKAFSGGTCGAGEIVGGGDGTVGGGGGGGDGGVLIPPPVTPPITPPLVEPEPAVPPPANAQACEWDNFKNKLAGSESGGKYTTVNSLGYLGKYQFGEAALADLGFYQDDSIASGNATQDWSGTFTGQAMSMGVKTKEDFLQNAEVQEAAFDKFMENNYNRSRGCHSFIGKTITSKQFGTCQVTLSGILGGSHLGGPGSASGCTGTCGLLACGQDRCDAYGTCISDYVCKFNGFATPFGGEAGACVPTSTGTPTGGGAYGGGVRGQELGNNWGRLSDTIRTLWISSLMLMAEQFSVNMMAQIDAIAKFFDAKDQLEAQRLIQQKTAEAHKDYQVSEQLCTFGTFSADLARAERTTLTTKELITKRMMARELGSGEVVSKTIMSDALSRMKNYREIYCNPADHANALRAFCAPGALTGRQNKDIDYTSTIDQRMTLNVDLTDEATTTDEQDVYALLDNLFMHDMIPRIPYTALNERRMQYEYMNLRSLVAMRGIARNSFANIISMRTATPEMLGSNGAYIKALYKELGVSDESEIQRILGENPSYYAQMEMLTRKIYQSPGFYTNLYDKPANVQRMRAAMQAIKLMNDRDIHAAMMRREMLMSMLLELRIRGQANNVYRAAQTDVFE